MHGYSPAKGAQVFECGSCCVARMLFEALEPKLRAPREINPVH
jgi:hypothetical protein